jgi:hypothetical protein
MFHQKWIEAIVPLGFELELHPQQQQAQLPLQKSKGAEGPASDWLAARK